MHLSGLIAKEKFNPDHYLFYGNGKACTNHLLNRFICWIYSFCFSEYKESVVAGKIASLFSRPLVFKGISPSNLIIKNRVTANLKKIEARYPSLKAAFEGMKTSPPVSYDAGMVFSHRNRYSDILPNEATRFMILDEPSFYFNANWVLGGKAIACQGPKKDEIEHFWTMAWESDASSIFMVTDLIQPSGEKCSRYWPEEGSIQFDKTNMTVAKQPEKTLFRDGNIELVETPLLLTKGGKQKVISHYQLRNWPDHGVISVQQLTRLVDILDNKALGDERFIVHCSAGIGRTGVLLAVYKGLQRIKEGRNDYNQLEDILSELRKERSHMVQTFEQERLVHQTILHLASRSN